MTIIIQKYGGTSMGDLNKISLVANKIIQAKNKGYKLAVVVSAMAGETNRLEKLAYQISSNPDSRELDVLLSTGEQASIALLSMMLNEKGYKSKSYTGFQIKVNTTNEYNKARITRIDQDRVLEDLEKDNIVIVAGFQGVDQNNNITTLGRGGSDTTAVALAAALKAEECQIFTDVSGVYTTDPKVVSDARKMEQVTFDEMLELSSLGAKVLQSRAVEFASKKHVPVRVLSTFEQGTGTLITDKKQNYDAISGITFSKEEARVIIRGLENKPGIVGEILHPISNENIEVDMISQNMVEDGSIDFNFTINRNNYMKTSYIIDKLLQNISYKELRTDNKISKLSLVGVGVRSYAGIASKMFKVLGDAGINIQLISTSEIKVSVLIDEKYIELGARLLHEAFGLSNNFVNKQKESDKLDLISNR